MHEHETVTLNRDCEAILIPIGTPLLLPKGAEVLISQALGGSYTVNVNGNLARISPMDADALGFDVEQSALPRPSTTDGKVDEELIWDQMRTCYDPEIPINIVDLGLIYHCGVTPVPDGGNRVDIVMTLTAPGCGMGQFLVEDVRSKVASVPNVTEVNVELTFDPPWNQSMMSEAAQLETGIY
ncbi:MAG: putative Fe-S cluster assembly protein SufT [Gammaproteobacteria bacterium]